MTHRALPRQLTFATAALTVTASLLLVAKVSGAEPDGTAPAALAGWKRESPAAGVDLYRGVLGGGAGTQDRWTVTIRGLAAPGAGKDVLGDPNDKIASGLLFTEKQAANLAAKLKAAGFTPRSEPVSWPADADRQGLIGVRVRVGSFDSEGEAKAEVKRVVDAGFKADSEWTGADGTPGTGRTEVQVAIIDPQAFTGSLGTSFGKTVAGKETVATMAKENDALLATNGGFFVMEPRDGVPGVSAGISASHGKLQSAATRGRIAAVLRADGTRIEFKHLSTSLSVQAGDQSEVIDGINRPPGVVRNCGGVGGDKPTERPRHDYTCSDPDEVVRFTSEFGAPTPTGAGLEAVLDSSQQVLELRPRGGEVPQGGSVLAGTGSGAEWLRAHALPGTQLVVKDTITDENGSAVTLGSGDGIVGGGPELVRNGKVHVDYDADGLVQDDPSFAYSFGLKRHPRTLLGVDAAGRVLLVTSNGRQPRRSDGLGLNEAASFMRELGAVDAMNLDGGGSTTMVREGEVITSNGEREVGDALILTAGKQPAASQNSPTAAPVVPAPGGQPSHPDGPPAANPAAPSPGRQPSLPEEPPAAPSVGARPSLPVEPPASNPVAVPSLAPSCTAPAWDRNAAYSGGQTVSLHGRVWKAQWWTQGDEPGTSGQWGAYQDQVHRVWQDAGAC
ncbi:phosphodiester glycosidase family protein [Streptomyces actinomycinicus]|uniref:Phosphodiester glycosidase family protein n=1 Tax=Streptomyces actinomycinicus TaxID=1695166 RepID=A0A937ERQ2_9ACTN|nr:phosphodiester glycosidase family protein [Streptomyces actinomycinicus]MBL1086986.1 phosphodiester glycosidase family protein [Streptomyces actinomycinicus]